MNKNKIEVVLENYKLNKKLKGYTYLIDTIMCNDRHIETAYKRVSELHMTNYKNVEKNIRYLLNNTYHEYFDYKNISNKKFIKNIIKKSLVY